MENKNKEKTNFFDTNEKMNTPVQYKKWGIIVCIILAICILLYILFSSDEKTEEEIQSTENTVAEQTTESVVPVEETIDTTKQNTVKEEKVDTKVPAKPGTSLENTASVQKQEPSKKATEKVVAPQERPVVKKQEPVKKSDAVVSEKQKDVPVVVELPKKSVKFIATDVVWVGIKYNGKAKDFILQPEAIQSIEFSGPMEIKVGDASALEIVFGDEVMRDLGKKGQVRNITINNG